METKKILLAEDEPGYYSVLQQTLTDAGYEVTLATNGTMALEKLKADSFDLVLLDLIMPQKNGFEVLEEAPNLPNWNKAPILVLSNLGQPDELRRSVSLGAADHIIKANYSLSDVLEKAKMYLNR